MDSIILDTFTTDDLLAVEGHLKDLNDVSSIEESLNQVCDCCFLYFYRDHFPSFVEKLYQTSLNSAFGHTQLVLTAMSDPERILKHVNHLERDESTGLTSCFTDYKDFVLKVLKKEYIEPICEMIEIDLRCVSHRLSGFRCLQMMCFVF